MDNPIIHITKVEIQGLWGRYDIEWNLHPDVNVLAGINGSGKTTIINSLYELLSKGNIDDSNIEMLILHFDQNTYGYVKIGNNHEKYSELINEYIEKGYFKKTPETSELLKLLNEDKEAFEKPTINLSVNDILNTLKISSLNDIFNINKISTFDMELKPLEAVQKLSDERVKTELDWELHLAIIKYWDYLLDISRKKDQIIETSDNPKEELLKLKLPQDRFIEIINKLITETGKKINRDENEVAFLLDNEKIHAYQLSSGEKQLLIILLTVLIQDNKPSILLLDEPEISLHIEWQRKLIKYIRELNPNVQLIIATHSPDIIMEGWLDKVFNIGDMIQESTTS